jgi:hypothetical protein
METWWAVFTSEDLISGFDLDRRIQDHFLKDHFFLGIDLG